jgi:hypothetical protein
MSGHSLLMTLASSVPVIFPINPGRRAWGVRRFYVCDPFGKLVNILTHLRLARKAVARSAT